jgi:DNA-directed RNA polymerase subunit RPC12/RpoP
MSSKPPKRLAQMAAEAAEAAGEYGGLACPRCNCRDLLADKTIKQTSRTIRYRRCRNCGHKVLTRQDSNPPPPETIIRDVDTYNEDSRMERQRLTIVRDSA